MRPEVAGRLLFPERVFADPPEPVFRFRLGLADRDRFCDDPLFRDPLRDAPVRAVALRPDPLRDAVVVRPAPPVRGPPAFDRTVVGRITSGGSSL